MYHTVGKKGAIGDGENSETRFERRKRERDEDRTIRQFRGNLERKKAMWVYARTRL